MAYYPDNESSGSTIRVGWLDKKVPFSSGMVDSTFLQRLQKLYRDRTNQTRGYHLCPFCTKPEFGTPVNIEGEEIKLGSAEIHVRDANGQTFIAPDLLYHYILVHGYCPPIEFIEAVCSNG